MKKRQIILNDYRTADDGLWTLSACKITKAPQVQNFQEVPGRFAPLDFSTTLTEGRPYYGNALLDAILESSEGTREERRDRILHLTTLLDGETARIVHPDFPDRYMVGRVQVTPDFNSLAYCVVAVSAVLEPWLYNDKATEVSVELTTAEQTITLTNSGKLSVCPTLEVTGSATLIFGQYTKTLSAGAYQLPELFLTTGAHSIKCKGSGSVTFTYREAVLAG